MAAGSQLSVYTHQDNMKHIFHFWAMYWFCAFLLLKNPLEQDMSKKLFRIDIKILERKCASLVIPLPTKYHKMFLFHDLLFFLDINLQESKDEFNRM
jgi:hypothetical protein